MNGIRGQELSADLTVSAAVLHDVDRLVEALVDGAHAVGGTVLSQHCQRFEPVGATVVVIIGESHLLVSTYPELELASLNVQTCSADMDLIQGLEAVSRRLEASEVRSMVVLRHLDVPFEVVLQTGRVAFRDGRLEEPGSPHRRPVQVGERG
ncbi:MAG TPA: S-adenosylmethionine decarboxylase [Thermoanaerobaculia bacterium]|nr:S-adenosylmethionine decarboxylase [Thermoanaerobaculia bacterium]